ncbi:hypothetical protein [Jeotgalibacillus aurantiacus]|nr:hypothetical protein [Jeotgalibacillus aurantiacus]
METKMLTMAIYLLALAQIEATGKTYVAKEIRDTQKKLHGIINE